MKKNFPSIAAALCLGVVTMPYTSVHAGSCKNLTENNCNTDTKCTWVEGYQRSDGRNVKAYCRNRPAKATADLLSTLDKSNR